MTRRSGKRSDRHTNTLVTERTITTNIANAPNSSQPIRFSSATLEDCSRADGLGLNLSHVQRPFNTIRTVHIPSDFPAATPSEFLCETWIRIHSVSETGKIFT